MRSGILFTVREFGAGPPRVWQGFLHGENHQTLVVATTPKHRGLALGEVAEVRARGVLVALTDERDLRPGMGVKFEPVGRAVRDPENDPGGPLFGVRMLDGGTRELRFGQPGPDLSRVRVGDVVRLTGDPEITSEAERRVKQPVLGRIPVALRVRGRAAERLFVEARACFGDRPLRAVSEADRALAPARSGGLDRALLTEKLGGFGGTPFQLAELDLTELAPALHTPVSELKRIRRELSAQLEADLLRNPYPKPSSHLRVPELRRELSRPNGEDAGPPELIALCRTEEQLEAVIASGGAAEVELDWMEMVGLGRAVERARGAGLRVTLATVRVQKPGEESYDRRIAALSPDGVLVRHWGALMHFAKAEFAPIVHGDFSLNVTNSLTAHHLLGLGLATVTASHDLNQTQLLDLITHVPRGRIALTLHHHIPTFHNSHCIYAHLLSSGIDYRTCGRPCEAHRIALRDYAGHDHPVVVDVGCRNTVFNAFAQSAAPLVPKLLALGVRRFRVELVWERGDETTRTLAAYRGLLSGELSANEALKAAAVHERYGVTTPHRGDGYTAHLSDQAKKLQPVPPK